MYYYVYLGKYYNLINRNGYMFSNGIEICLVYT